MKVSSRLRAALHNLCGWIGIPCRTTWSAGDQHLSGRIPLQLNRSWDRPGSLQLGCVRFSSRLAVALATLGIVFPLQWLKAAERTLAEIPVAVPPIASSAVIDVCLAKRGTLHGRVVDDSGRPEPARLVTLYRAGRVVGVDVTAASGDFSIAGLRGGVHELAMANGRHIVRLWAPGTAPPAAVTRVLLVHSVAAVRGQQPPGPLGRGYERLKCWLADPLVVAGIIATAVAIPVVVHNANQDRDSGS